MNVSPCPSWRDAIRWMFVLTSFMIQIQCPQASFTQDGYHNKPPISSFRGRFRRMAIRSEVNHWPNAIIPYVIDHSVLNVSTAARGVILAAMDHWSTETCIKFEEYDKKKHGVDYLFVTARSSSRCESQMGRLGGKQFMYVNKNCLTRGIMIHELGHVVGFIHEHNRPDRDKYIIIQWDKIKAHVHRKNYKKRSEMLINTYGIPYDFSSIMQYRSLDDELLAKDPRKQHLMGQRNGLSFLDKKLVNLMYKCNRSCKKKDIKCNPPGFVNFRCQCICPKGLSPCSTSHEALQSKGKEIPRDIAKYYWSYNKGIFVGAPPKDGLSVNVKDFTECKLRCFEEQSFPCLSVHYIVNRPSAWSKVTRTCYLQRNAGKPGKMRFIRSNMTYYIETPGGFRKDSFCGWDAKNNTVLYPDDEFSKITYGLSLNLCKVKCVDEWRFRCMAFMYRQVNKDNTVCIHTSRTFRTIAKNERGSAPGVTYYERKTCGLKESS